MGYVTEWSWGGKSITIQMFIGASSVTWDSYRGEAPQLSSTYGIHDNGATVFPLLYDNFSGTTLDAKWKTVGSGVSVNNGIKISLDRSNNYGAVVSSGVYDTPAIAEGLYDITNTAGTPNYQYAGESLSNAFSGNGSYSEWIENGYVFLGQQGAFPWW